MTVIRTLIALLYVLTVATAAENLSGESIKVLVGGSPGGGEDLYARLLVRYMPDHLPGKPAMYVEDAPGNGGRRTARLIASARSETVIGIIPTTALLAPLYDERSPGFRLGEISTIGSADSGTRVCVVTARSGIRRFADVQSRAASVGAGGQGSSLDVYPHMLNNLAHAKFRVIPGYRGTPEIFFAMRAGDIDGICGVEWTTVWSQEAERIRTGELRVIIQTGPRPYEPLANFGPVLDMRDVIAPADRPVAELITEELLFSRVFGMSSRIRPERLSLLRHAFADTMRDPRFVRDATTIHLGVQWQDGASVQTLIERMQTTPSALMQRAKRARLDHAE